MFSPLFTAFALIASGQAGSSVSFGEPSYVANVRRKDLVEWGTDDTLAPDRREPLRKRPRARRG